VKLTMIGAGVRAPFVLHGLAERERDLGLTEVVLHDAGCCDGPLTRLIASSRIML
jgi:hypothetical protein